MNPPSAAEALRFEDEPGRRRSPQPEPAGRVLELPGTGARVTERERAAREICPWLLRYPLRTRPPGRAYRLVKRAIDLAAVLVLAPIWLPVYLVAALVVKLDGPAGPVHFVQPRAGLHGAPFDLRKLRTMVPDAEAMKESLRHLNQRTWPDFKVDPDPRVTRVGLLLRSTSLDELPQLVNVLRGDMSLVGPRPISLDPGDLTTWHRERFDVPAGLTGVWQIAARGSASFTERLRLDLAYVNRRCLRLDLEILLRTIPAVVLRRGAA